MIREVAKKHWKKILVAALCTANLCIWYVVYWENRGEELTVAFLNVGQGDAIFIEAPNGNQMIIDGGPNRSLLSELANMLPFYDRSIDMILVTNPDRDHFAGFIDLLQSYEVREVIKPATHSDTATYATFEKSVEEKHIKTEVAQKGMKVILDKARDIHLDILFPDRDVSSWDSNDGSTVARLVYGTTSYMLMGDATRKTEGLIMSSDEDIHADMLKLGHHGSKTSSGFEFVKNVAPRYAIISAGFHNKYGHPHNETLQTLSSLQIVPLITFERGSIVTKSDGKRITSHPASTQVLPSRGE